LSQTNHTILTYGTFGMWSSLMNQGMATYPALFLNKTKEMKEIAAAHMSNWHFIV